MKGSLGFLVAAVGLDAAGSASASSERRESKPVAAVSPAIYRAVASGTAFAKVLITIRRNGADFAVFTLGLAVLSSVQGTATPDLVADIGLAYGAVIWQVKGDPSKRLPSPAYGWNRSRTSPPRIRS